MLRTKNELTQAEDFNNQNAVFILKIAVQETAKIYGPIFTRMVSENALQFEAEKLKEKTPQNLPGLDDVFNYIIANLDKYPRGYNSLIYGIAKAESKLQGSTASGAKRAAYSAVKAILQSSGLLNSVIGTTEDAFESIEKSSEIGKAAKTSPAMRFIREENNGVTIVVPDCPFKDACRSFVKEGISRLVGGSECINLIDNAASVEIITKKQFDYRLEEFDKPQCRGRIFEV
jgi:hypothetical protein